MPATLPPDAGTLATVDAAAEHRQLAYRVRLEWAREGAELLTAECAVVVVVDVLSFCTAVDVALGRGARVLPQAGDDPVDAAREARELGGVAAYRERSRSPSLSPTSLRTLAAGTLLCLPSPNGATLCRLAGGGGAAVFAGCLRNASAVAAAARAAAGTGPIGLVPAGERWPGGTLRVAAEDALGAGAVAAALDPDDLSPEAELAAAQFAAARRAGLHRVLPALAGGRELVALGCTKDVELAAAHDTSSHAPRLACGPPRVFSA